MSDLVMLPRKPLDHEIPSKTKELMSSKKRQTTTNNLNGLKLQGIKPKTDAQADVFEAYNEGFDLLLSGTAGTGKTFVAMFLALKDLIEKRTDKIYIIRSTVPVREMGYLPGNQLEKLAPYEEVYVKIVNELFGRGDAYEILKQKGFIEFISTSFLRGTTFSNCVMFVDELENFNAAEANTVITRVGEHCRVILVGDIEQTDLNYKQNDKCAFAPFVRVIQEMECFETVEFGVEDIVRSGLVKQYILAKRKLGITF